MNFVADRALTDADFKRISDMVYQHCGINLHDGKKQLVQARVAKRLRHGNFQSLGDYLDFAVNDPSGKEFTLLIDAMSTNLTSFYRESDHFRFMIQTAIPDLLRRKQKSGDRRIRLWSAASSTGEEPYTLAMTMLDGIKDAGRWDIKILASDISTHVLRVAKRGFYSADRLKPLPQGYAQRFFCPANLEGTQGYEVSDELKQMVAFRHVNLMDEWPFTGPFDFIFCRNVMIYFDKPTQERLVNRFHTIMNSGGILFTGHSESLTGVKHPFDYLRPTVYGKR